jgi:hypothetical protein
MDRSWRAFGSVLSLTVNMSCGNSCRLGARPVPVAQRKHYSVPTSRYVHNFIPEIPLFFTWHAKHELVPIFYLFSRRLAIGPYAQVLSVKISDRR